MSSRRIGTGSSSMQSSQSDIRRVDDTEECKDVKIDMGQPNDNELTMLPAIALQNQSSQPTIEKKKLQNVPDEST